MRCPAALLAGLSELRSALAVGCCTKVLTNMNQCLPVQTFSLVPVVYLLPTNS